MKKIVVFCLLNCFFLSTGIQVYAEDLREQYEQGEKAFSKRDFKKAIEIFEKVVAAYPNFAPAYNMLGMTKKEAGVSLSEVIWYFKTAVQLDPKLADAYENMGKAYYGLGQFDNAEKNCLKALEVNPDYLKSKLSLGWIYLLGKNQSEDAIRYFKEVLESAPVANAYFGLGMAYFMTNNSAEVLEMITKLKELKENQLATQLEDMLRGSHYKSDSAAGKSLLDTPRQEEAPYAPMTMQSADPAQVQMRGTAVIQVRLKGKLMMNEENTKPPQKPAGGY